MSYITFFILIPIAGALIIILLGRKIKFLSSIIGVLAAGTLLLFSLFLYITKSEGVYSACTWPANTTIAFRIDGFSSLLLLFVNLVCFASVLFSTQYISGYSLKYKYIFLFLLILTGINGVILSGDLLDLFIFLEIATAGSYAFIIFGSKQGQYNGLYKHIVPGIIGSILILSGIILVYRITGSLNMRIISEQQLYMRSSSLIFILVSALFISGFSIKTVLIPFYPWSPETQSADSGPVSTVLSGVLLKVLGIYVIVRIFFNVIGMSSSVGLLLIVLGSLSMVFGVILATGREDLNSLFVYHSISQTGYVLASMGTGGYLFSNYGNIFSVYLAVFGALFHLLNHVVSHSLLCVCSGSIEYTAKTRMLNEIGGLRKRMPVTRISCTVASLSIAGIPPLTGFWSSLIILVAIINAAIINIWFLLLTVIVFITHVITFFSFSRVLGCAFPGKLKKTLSNVKESPVFMGLSMLLLSLFCVVGGLLLLPHIRKLVIEPALSVLTGVR